MSRKVCEPTIFTAVAHPVTGRLTSEDSEMVMCVETHPMTVFDGDTSPVRRPVTDVGGDERVPPLGSKCPILVSSENSETLENDPSGWLDKDFVLGDVVEAVGSLKSGKAS